MVSKEGDVSNCHLPCLSSGQSLGSGGDPQVPSSAGCFAGDGTSVPWWYGLSPPCLGKHPHCGRPAETKVNGGQGWCVGPAFRLLWLLLKNLFSF